MNPASTQASDLPAAVGYTLEKMRAKFNYDPESLLETIGTHTWTPPHAHCFIDLIGFDDELIDTVRLPVFVPVYRTPIRERLLVQYDGLKPMRVAEWYPTNWQAVAHVDPMHAPGWRYDVQSMLVEVWLKRYRRVRA